MNFKNALFLISAYSIMGTFNVKAEEIAVGVDLQFTDRAQQFFNESQKKMLRKSVIDAQAESKSLLTGFPTNLTIQVSVVDKDLNEVGGVSGIAQTPTSLNLDFSSNYSGGINRQLTGPLKNTLYHEFHHLARGWTIEGNKFGPGIPIAAVNEGLAVVYAETYSKVSDNWITYPTSISDWVAEILELPVNAPYDVWMMGTHQDGRKNIGYKAGKYIVSEAIKKSGKDVIALTAISPYEILALSEKINGHSASLEKLGDYYAKMKQSDKALSAYEQAVEASDSKDNPSTERYKKKISLIKHPLVLSKETLKALVGDYTSTRLNLSVVLSESKNGLKVKLPGKPDFELHPDGKDTFFIYEADITFRFAERNKSEPLKLEVSVFGNRLELVKSE